MANLLSFDLNLLRVLHALLEDPSTTRAGDRLGLSQPAVSAALSRLRHALGDELFFRKGQRLEATDYARTLTEPLQGIMRDLEDLIAAPGAFDPATASGNFRISGSDYFAELLMPRLALLLQDAAPGIRTHLVDLVHEHHIDPLESHDVDVAIVRAPTTPDWVAHQPALRSGFLAVARSGHPRLKRAKVKAGDVIPIDLFCDLGHVAFSNEGNEKTMGDSALAKVGRERRVVMTLPSFGSVYRAVAASDLVALLPSALARHAAPTAGLTVYRAPMPLPQAELHMLWHRRHSSNPMHAWMRSEIAKLLAELNED